MKLLEEGTMHWIESRIHTDTYGFTVLPGGIRSYDGAFYGIGEDAYFIQTWSFSNLYQLFKGKKLWSLNPRCNGLTNAGNVISILHGTIYYLRGVCYFQKYWIYARHPHLRACQQEL